MKKDALARLLRDEMDRCSKLLRQKDTPENRLRFRNAMQAFSDLADGHYDHILPKCPCSDDGPGGRGGGCQCKASRRQSA